jgi:hypothetical protein
MEATYLWPPWLSESYHPTPVITLGEGFTCSFCDRKIPLAAPFVCCRLCGYDMCAQCHKGIITPSSKACAIQ